MAVLKERRRRADQARAQCGEESMCKDRREEEREEEREERREGPHEPMPGKCMNDSTTRTEQEWHLMSGSWGYGCDFVLSKGVSQLFSEMELINIKRQMLLLQMLKRRQRRLWRWTVPLLNYLKFRTGEFIILICPLRSFTQKMLFRHFSNVNGPISPTSLPYIVFGAARKSN